MQWEKELNNKIYKMKKLIVLFLWLLTINLNATTYYVAASGGNNGNPGTISSPWATLAYAVTAVSSGDIIYMQAGTHTVNTSIVVPVGVSITGAGATSIISSTLSGDEYSPVLALMSATQGTNGNQSISYIKMDGNSRVADCAILVAARSNVKIHHVDVINFQYWGIIFNGVAGGWDGVQPSTYATGNEIYNCTITDCAGYYDGWGRGNLGVGGQQGLLCHDNTITQPARGTSWSHGWCWKFFSDGYNKGLKIYNNHLIKAPFMGEWDDWDFAMEFCMHEQGGIEIYDNIIEGEINLGARRKGDYTYSFYIHNNTIGKATRNNQREIGIGTENVINDLYIRYNYFHNLAFGMYTHGGDAGDNSNNVFVQYNIFDQIGNAVEACGWEGYVGNGNGNHHNWYIENNVYTQYSGYTGGNGKGFMFMPTEDMSYIYFRNNIYVGWDYTPVLGYNGGGGSLNYFYFQNNLIYNCGSSNTFYWESGYNPTNVTDNGNIRGSNPSFVGGSPYSYVLQVGSPAKDAGLNLSLVLDYAGNVVPYNVTPDIGAYEYGSSPPGGILVTSITVSGTGGATTITTDNGTLQMLASVLPENADDKTVTWSRTNGTGTASISSGGLLTASTDGTVIVRATANDGSGVYDDQIITISNQTIPVIINKDVVVGNVFIFMNGKKIYTK